MSMTKSLARKILHGRKIVWKWDSNKKRLYLFKGKESGGVYSKHRHLDCEPCEDSYGYTGLIDAAISILESEREDDQIRDSLNNPV